MTRKLTFCAMLSVLGALCLLLANLLQTTTIFLYLFSTLFCYIATQEHGIRYGLLTYVTVTLLGFLLVTDKLSMIAYAAMGYYPVLKYLIDHKFRHPAVRWSWKFGYAAALAAIACVFFRQLLAVKLPLPLIIAVGFVIFMSYDIMLGMGIRFYALRLRNWRK